MLPATPFVTFFLLLAFSSLIIMGFFLSSRGKEEELPDGSIRRSGNIFKGWYFYWMQYNGHRSTWYNWEHALQFMHDARGVLSQLGIDRKEMVIAHPSDLPKDFNCDAGWPIKVSTVVQYHIAYLELQLKVRILAVVRPMLESSGDPAIDEMIKINRMDYLIFVAQREPRYRFPWWVRKMLVSCPTCHASIYGSLIFIVLHLACGDLLAANLYSWFSCSTWVSVPLVWVAQTLSLAYILTYLNKKVS